MAWFGLAKIAFQAGTHIYKKRQETKMAMADAQPVSYTHLTLPTNREV